VVLRNTGSSVEVSIQHQENLFSVVDASVNVDLADLTSKSRHHLQAALRTFFSFTGSCFILVKRRHDESSLPLARLY
jgi:hypothetical protein